MLRTACDVGCNAQRTTQSCTRNETKLQRNETKLQRVATSCVATKLQRVATSTTPTQVRHKSFLSRRRAALVATICSLLRDKTEKQTHDVSVGLLTQYVSLLREVCFCVSPRCAICQTLAQRPDLVGDERPLASSDFRRQRPASTLASPQLLRDTCFATLASRQRDTCFATLASRHLLVIDTCNS